MVSATTRNGRQRPNDNRARSDGQQFASTGQLPTQQPLRPRSCLRPSRTCASTQAQGTRVVALQGKRSPLAPRTSTGGGSSCSPRARCRPNQPSREGSSFNQYSFSMFTQSSIFGRLMQHQPDMARNSTHCTLYRSRRVRVGRLHLVAPLDRPSPSSLARPPPPSIPPALVSALVAALCPRFPPLGFSRAHPFPSFPPPPTMRSRHA